MANKNIKGITIEINGDVTKLDKALSQVDKDLSVTQKNLKEVDRLLKLDPGNLELVDQKQRLLAKSVEDTSKRYETLKKTLEQSTASNVRFDQWEQAQKSIQGEITKTENALTKLLGEQQRMKDLKFAPDSNAMVDMQKEIDATRQRAEELRQKAAETYEQLGRPISIEQFDALQRELADSKIQMENAQKASSDFANGVETLGSEEQQATGLTSKLSDVLGKAGLSTAALSAAGVIALAAAAIKEFAEFTKEAIVDAAKYGDEIQTLSTKFHIATDTMQEYQYMAELTDTSVDTITSSITKLTRSMDKARDGNKEVDDAFAKLNISVTDANGELRDANEVFLEAIDGLGRIHNETERDVVSMELFGKSAMELNSLIAVGSKGIEAYAQEARDLGYVLSDEELDALRGTQDQFDRLDKAMEMAKNRIAIELAPQIKDLTEQLIDFIKSTNWEMVGQGIATVIRIATPLIVSMAMALAGLAESVAVLVNAIDSLFNVNTGGGIGFTKDSFRVSSVPGFASGAVVEPNSPMLAVVGDNRTEREVIAPRSEIVDAAREAIRAEGGAGHGKIVGVVKFTGTDQEIVRALGPKLELLWTDRGNSV